jgi:HEAT repeat protein
MLALALGNMQDDRAVNTLIELLDDEEVAGHALIGLGRLGSREAIPHLAPFLDHPTSWIRNEARNALRRMERG